MTEDFSHTVSTEQIRRIAVDTGFSEAGIIGLPHAHEALDGTRFAAWIKAGHAGSMQYLERHNEQGELLRLSSQIPFPWARSAIVTLASYNSHAPHSIDAHPEDSGWISRYAWSSRIDADGQPRPSDYHKVLKKRIEQLEAKLRDALPENSFEARGFVDTGPVNERALARAAGIGWSGKNCCLIHPKFGSFVFLSVLFTSLEIAPEPRPTLVADHCGRCRRCLDACPTGALLDARSMDARRCIAYLTIEHKGVLDEALLPGIGRQILGCDICQDVCPWNRKAVIAHDAAFTPRAELLNPDLDALGSLTEIEFEKKFNGSPIRRAGYLGLLRNVAVAMGNSGQARFRPRLKAWSTSDNEPLRAAARWALERRTLSLK